MTDGDRNGLTLRPGDPVLYQPSEDAGVTATVLRRVRSGRYLIQLDGPRPVADTELGAIERQCELMERMKYGAGTDLQDPVEVPGAKLVFIGEPEWADDVDEKSADAATP